MKIKLNKEQVAFINGLDTPEAKQEFLLNCFLHQCEEKLKYDSDEIKTSCDEPRNYTLGEIASKVAEFAVDKIEKENMLHFDLPKQSSREKFDKFIEDNRITKELDVDDVKHFFRTPYIVGFGVNREPCSKEFLEEVDRAKSYYDSKLFEEWLNYKPLHPDKVKKYTKEDLEYCFNASRADIMGLPVFNNFEEYFKSME